MKNIGPGHWVFAGVFAVVFLLFLIWAYRKDMKMHKIHYKGSFGFLLALVVIMFVIWVFRGYFN